MTVIHKSANNTVAPIEIHGAITTHTGTKSIEYLYITNTDNESIRFLLSIGGKNILNSFVLAAGETLDLLEGFPMTVQDTDQILFQHAAATYTAEIHTAIKLPEIKNTII